MSIGRNIRQLRDEHQITQKQLAKIAGVTDKAVSLWEQDLRDPRMGAVQRMADYFGITKSKILDGRPSPLPFMYHSMTVPVLKRISGDGFVITADEIESHEVLPCVSLPAGEYVCLREEGDDMSPKIEKNDILVIRLQNTVENGEYAVVSIGGSQGVVGRVFYEAGQTVLVRENLPESRQVFRGSKQNQIRIIGCVKQIRRNL